MRNALLLLLCLLLAACGFHLRGAQPLPFDSIYLGLSAYSEMGAELRRHIAVNGHTRVMESSDKAQVTLLVMQDTQDKSIVALNTDGRVREFELQRRFVFKLVDQAGHEVIPATEITVRRDMTYDDSLLLAKSQEEAQIFADLQKDVVQQLLRRLAAAPWPLPESRTAP